MKIYFTKFKSFAHSYRISRIARSGFPRKMLVPIREYPVIRRMLRYVVSKQFLRDLVVKNIMPRFQRQDILIDRQQTDVRIRLRPNRNIDIAPGTNFRGIRLNVDLQKHI